MSSSEEYLDSLLKAIMEGNTSAESSSSTVQDVTAADSEQETVVPEEPDRAMDTDAIEAVFVSADTETEEDAQAAVPADDGTLFDERLLDDGMLSSELPIEEETLYDNHAVKEKIETDELILENVMRADELSLVDSIPSGELTPDYEAITDDFGLFEAEMADHAQEQSVEESAAMDDLNLDELGLGDLGLEELGLEKIERDELETGDDFMMENVEEDSDGFMLEDVGEEGDGLALEDIGEDSDGFALEDIGEEGDGLALEDAGEEDGGFALEEMGEEDEDLSALLASMGADDDLSEINDLLEKSDQGVVVDDDIMAMLDGVSGEEEEDDSFDFLSIEGNPEDIREITPEELEERGDRKARKKAEKERKKREKLAKKAKGKIAAQDIDADGGDADELSDLLTGMDEAGEKPKNRGALSKFLDFLLEEDEEENDSSGESSDHSGEGLASLTEENREILAELQAEDKKNAKKKDKKEKKAKKDKKDKKDKGGEKVEAKPKKPKKEKKKKEKIEEEPQIPEKKLSKKKVVSVFVFCATVAACIGVLTILLPVQLEKKEARVAFDQNQYTQVYGLLYGKELSEEDEVLLQKSSTILKLQRKLDSYENYVRMDMPLEALDALLGGVSRYYNLREDAELYNVSDEVADIYGQILDTLAYNYGLSESDALDIIASEDDVTYSRRIQGVISGDSFGVSENEPALPETKQDVLPEEEEIIDRLEEQLEEGEIIDGLEEQSENEEITDGLEDTVAE